MDIQQMRQAAAEAASTLRSLSHPDRLMLLCQLSQGERSVGELEELLGIQQPNLSQQLGVLHSEGLVDALVASNNPAGTVWIGDRLDLGTTFFAPDHHASIQDNSAGDHYNGNARDLFLIPSSTSASRSMSASTSTCRPMATAVWIPTIGATPMPPLAAAAAPGWISATCSSPSLIRKRLEIA